MHSESSGNINYWPGFVDAFSNLVLALVFVIVILAMSLGMFSGLMAKMAIQRALIEQRLDESKTVPGSPAAGQDGGVSAGGKGLAAQAGTQPADPGRGGRSEAVDAADTADAAGGADGAGGTDGPAGPDGPNGADGSGSAKAQASQSVQWASGPVGNDLPLAQAEGADGDAPGMPPPVMPAAVRAAPASGVGAASASGVDAGAAVGAGEGVARDETTRGRDERAAASAGTSAQAREHATLRRENDALRQELAVLRKKQAALAQRAAGAAPGSGPVAAGGNALGASAAGGNAAGNAEAGGGHPKSADKFGPTMPEDDHSFRQRIEDDLQRTLKEFEARRDSGVSIDVVIYVPNYALTENKRTALFYLISIKDYLMKRKVAPGQIRMHMAPASAGQKDMTVSMSVEP